jgi:UDP-glucose 4-epimerase
VLASKTWLITGGAGYIGAHIAEEFLRDGKDIVIYDSLYLGLESRIEYLRKKYSTEIPLIIADIRDINSFTFAIQKYKPLGIVHTAALKSVDESIKKPDMYFEINYQATKKLLDVISSLRVKRFIFSSTAAVYGSPVHSNLIREDEPKNPISPYGASKLAAESLVNEFLDECENLGTSLRFFNVVGTASHELSDKSRDNLVPIVLDKVRNDQTPVIFGTNYPTPDGTCIRDYVDVRDIAKAHLAVANWNQELPRAMNIGRGVGTSVREVILLVAKMANKEGAFVIDGDPRAGDCPSLIADSNLIKQQLGVQCDLTLQDSVSSLFRT